MYKFLPEQIKNLEEQFEIENRKFNDILEIRKEDYLERKTGQGNETIVIFDNSLLDKSFKNAIELNDIKNKLLNCEIIESSNSDEIGIGSTCEISFDENDKNLILTLIETRLPRDPSNFISISSP